MKQCRLRLGVAAPGKPRFTAPEVILSECARMAGRLGGSAGRGEAKFAPSAWEKLTVFEIGWADWWTCWVALVVTHRSVVVSVPHPYLCRRDAAPYTRFRGRHSHG